MATLGREGVVLVLSRAGAILSDEHCYVDTA